MLGGFAAGPLPVRALHPLGRPALDLLLLSGLAAGLLSVLALLLVRLDSAYTYCGMEGGRRAKIRARSPRTVSCPPAPLHSLAVLGGAGSPCLHLPHPFSTQLWAQAPSKKWFKEGASAAPLVRWGAAWAAPRRGLCGGRRAAPPRPHTPLTRPGHVAAPTSPRPPPPPPQLSPLSRLCSR